jgi:thioredoxin reductase
MADDNPFADLIPRNGQATATPAPNNPFADLIPKATPSATPSMTPHTDQASSEGDSWWEKALAFAKKPSPPWMQPAEQFIREQKLAPKELFPAYWASKEVQFLNQFLPEKYQTPGKVLSGAEEGVAEAASSFTTPGNLGLAALSGGVGPTAGKMISGVFLGQAIWGTPEQWRALQAAPTLEEKTRIATAMAASYLPALAFWPKGKTGAPAAARDRGGLPGPPIQPGVTIPSGAVGEVIEQPTTGVTPDAIKPSDAQIQARATPQRIETRPEGEVPKPGDSDYAVGKAEGAETGREIPPEPVPSGEAVAATPSTTDEPIISDAQYKHLQRKAKAGHDLTEAERKQVISYENRTIAPPADETLAPRGRRVVLNEIRMQIADWKANHPDWETNPEHAIPENLLKDEAQIQADLAAKPPETPQRPGIPTVGEQLDEINKPYGNRFPGETESEAQQRIARNRVLQSDLAELRAVVKRGEMGLDEYKQAVNDAVAKASGTPEGLTGEEESRLTELQQKLLRKNIGRGHISVDEARELRELKEKQFAQQLDSLFKPREPDQGEYTDVDFTKIEERPELEDVRDLKSELATVEKEISDFKTSNPYDEIPSELIQNRERIKQLIEDVAHRTGKEGLKGGPPPQDEEDRVKRLQEIAEEQKKANDQNRLLPSKLVQERAKLLTEQAKERAAPRQRVAAQEDFNKVKADIDNRLRRKVPVPARLWQNLKALQEKLAPRPDEPINRKPMRDLLSPEDLQKHQDLQAQWSDINFEFGSAIKYGNKELAMDLALKQRDIKRRMRDIIKKLPGSDIYDVVGVGGGPTNQTAGIYAGAEDLSMLILDVGQFGGASRRTPLYQNVTGVLGQTGRERALVGRLAAERHGTEFRRIHALDGPPVFDPKTKLWTIKIKGPGPRGEGGETLRARTWIGATGTRGVGAPFPIVNAAGKVLSKSQFDKKSGLPVTGSPEDKSGVKIHLADGVSAAIEANGGESAAIGGANSAGQGAIDMALMTRELGGDPVHIIHRGNKLSMSGYLQKDVGRLAQQGWIKIHLNSEVDHLEPPSAENGWKKVLVLKKAQTRSEIKAGKPVEITEKLPVDAVASFVGGKPVTGWLPGHFLKDEKGFARTTSEAT